MFIRVNIDYKENIATVEKRKATNVLMIKDVLSQRETHINKSNINIRDNSLVIIIINSRPRKSKSV